MTNCFGFPYLGHGIGLRTPHYEEMLQAKPSLDCLEIISENFIDAHQGYWDLLAALRQNYVFTMHGVSLSIGSTDNLNYFYLEKLKKLADFLQPAWISDHLCFTGIMGKNTHDLLPIPYTEEALSHLITRIRLVQEYLERPLILENPSSYISFTSSTFSEWEFLSLLATETNCGILLDINNIYVSAFNQHYDPFTYIDHIPANRIIQLHLSGHTDHGNYKVDTHNRTISEDVWELYRYTLQQKGPISTIIEWDDHIPSLREIISEVEKAKNVTNSLCLETAL